MINIGILGLGKISERVAQGISEAKNAHLYGLASTNIEKAKKMQDKFQTNATYEVYEDMMKDSNIDMIYIATPNKSHYENIMQCLKYKKHVICEKPMVATMSELSEIFEYAKKQRCFLMEAEKTVFTALNQKVKKMIGEGIIGEVISIQASYCENTYDEQNSNHWVFDSTFGGSLFDIGVYPICYTNFIAHSFVDKVNIKSVFTKKGYDIANEGDIYYQNGIHANISSGWACNPNNIAIIQGTRGSIITENFWKNHVAKMIVKGKEEMIEVPYESDFKGEVEHAVSCVEKKMLESPIMGYTQSAEILHVVMQGLGKEDE